MSQDIDKVLSKLNLLQNVVEALLVNRKHVVEDSLEGMAARHQFILSIPLDRLLVKDSVQQHGGLSFSMKSGKHQFFGSFLKVDLAFV
jgi:hypothetical protein